MDDGTTWQCGKCATLIDGPETRKCPNCGGINFYPLADEVPGDDTDNDEETVRADSALDRFVSDEG